MKKVAVLYLLLAFSVFADELHTGEIIINILGNSGNTLLDFDVSAQGTVWNEYLLVTDSLNGGAVNDMTTVVRFDIFDTNSNTVELGIGLYKIEVTDNTGTYYFFYDLRSAYISSIHYPNHPSLDVYFDFDYQTHQFKLHDSTNSINGQTKTIWDLKPSIQHITSGLEVQPPVNLTQTASSGSAHLSWARNDSFSDYWTGYQISRKISGIDNDFSVISTTNATTTTYVDNGVIVNGNGVVSYKIKSINDTVYSGSSEPLSVSIVDMNKQNTKAFVKENYKTTLFPCYPNPFNPSTNIRYQVMMAGQVTLSVYDIIGNKIASLVDETKSAGEYSMNYNPKNLPSGCYILVLQTMDNTSSIKLVLTK